MRAIGTTTVVVGAGPAGVRAVETLLAHGLRPVWIDEAARAGGQIYRRAPANFQRPAAALYGFEAGKAERLHRAADAAAAAADYRPETLAWDIAEAHLQVAGPGGIEAIGFDALILATGAMDRVIPLPGWTMPGVYSLGGAQVALKAQGCAIGRRTILLGTGPLLYLVAHQYAKAGAGLAAVLDTSPATERLRALPDLVAGGAMLAKGMYYVARLRRRGIRIESGVEPLTLLGATAVEGLRFRAGGSEREIAGDALALGYGLASETQLADLAGCRFAFDSLNRQWLPLRDREGRAADAASIYLAGDGAGIGGADAAELAGELAALALLADRGVGVSPARRARIARRLARLGRFRRGLEAAFPFPARLARGLADETILCRCEAVTAGELRASVGALDADELNRAKAYSRIGMGRCQGRVCGPAAAEILAEALGRDIADIGRLRRQPPVKPLPLSQL
jgi:hydrogen cyanide synthase HcnB